jgi:arylsulfatase A-like enzyme
MRLAAFVLVFALALTSRAEEPRAPWNIVLITVDALRADRMSLYGHTRETTPQLASFARDAAVFEQFYAASAHTSPGIVSLLTGQAPPVHAQTTQFSFYDAHIPSPLRALAARGYDVVGYAVRGATYADLGFTRGLDGKPAEALLDELAQAEQPFFAWLHTRETHLPYQPAPELSGKFTRGLALESPLLRAVRTFSIVLRDASAPMPYRHAGQVAASDADREPLRALYDECVASADARVGAWLAQLRARGLLERTIVVITADHGEELLEHGWVGHASTGYDAKLEDALLRIPLIVRVPGGAHAGRFRALASQVDLMPTLFELLGIAAPELAANQQGVSLAPILRGEKRSVRELVFAETTRKGWTTPREETRDRLAAVRRAGARARWAPPPEQFASEHRAAAARIVHAAARAHLAALAEAFGRGESRIVIAEWQAIARLHDTWGLERAPFHAGDDAWTKLRVRAAELASAALRCDARGLPLEASGC